MRISTKYSKQRGASALESSLALAPVLLVFLLSIELVHAHQSKQLLSLALQEAGRRASVTSADHHTVNQAFARALAPLFTPAGQHNDALARLEATVARYQRLYSLPLWQLELTELSSHSVPPSSHRALQLDLLYLHEPKQAWLRHALRQSARWLSAGPKELMVRARQQGLVAIPLRRRVMRHYSEVKLGKEEVIDGAQPTPRHALNAARSLAPMRFESRPTAEPNVSRDVLDRAKTSNLSVLRQTLDKDNLCGVLLCCAR